ncbi:MAG TPA: hypothetical protein VLQ79_02290, partial [Myxococcaceae bacterium]|nr:hypothetical protein [Myxococcaceae bacterium]
MTIDLAAFRRFELQGWEARAQAYTDHFTPVMERCIGPLLDAAGIRPGSRLLDVATGPGTVCGHARARGALPIGLDFAPAMLEIA